MNFWDNKHLDYKIDILGEYFQSQKKNQSQILPSNSLGHILILSTAHSQKMV